MNGPCSNLGGAGNYALLTLNTGGTGLCRGEIARVVDTQSRITVGSCSFGDSCPMRSPGTDMRVPAVLIAAAVLSSCATAPSPPRGPPPPSAPMKRSSQARSRPHRSTACRASTGSTCRSSTAAPSPTASAAGRRTWCSFHKDAERSAPRTTPWLPVSLAGLARAGGLRLRGRPRKPDKRRILHDPADRAVQRTELGATFRSEI